MRLTQAVLLIVTTTLFCGVIGMGIGNAIGTLMPGYYRALTRPEIQPYFDPIAFGKGLGLSQGLGTGVAISLVLVIVLTWGSTRSRTKDTVQQLRAQVQRLQEQVQRLEQTVAQMQREERNSTEA